MIPGSALHALASGPEPSQSPGAIEKIALTVPVV